ncbi:MAG: D-alanyl-D-alanine carboxypeptidase family protein [Ignavibacteriaceae bacterium]|nr:D-alanyl-D-alanine carboxypeptidase family protein [Ignavibacteriaceae bacterium]
MKKLIIALVTLLILTAGLYYTAFIPLDYEQLNFIQKPIAESINKKFSTVINQLPPERRSTADFDTLMNSLNWYERMFAKKVFNIKPAELGFKGPFYSIEKPKNLLVVATVKLVSGENERETGVQNCPPNSYADYLKMADKMEQDIGRRVYIDSGYRSPGKQAYLFFYYLVTSSNFSLKENSKWIAMPGYSEHGHPVNNAIDFTTIDGINGFSGGQTASDFASTPEYYWMTENAGNFNFYLSYPQNNNLGVEYEPWHWHWGGK